MIATVHINADVTSSFDAPIDAFKYRLKPQRRLQSLVIQNDYLGELYSSFLSSLGFGCPNRPSGIVSELKSAVAINITHLSLGYTGDIETWRPGASRTPFLILGLLCGGFSSLRVLQICYYVESDFDGRLMFSSPGRWGGSSERWCSPIRGGQNPQALSETWLAAELPKFKKLEKLKEFHLQGYHGIDEDLEFLQPMIDWTSIFNVQQVEALKLGDCGGCTRLMNAFCQLSTGLMRLFLDASINVEDMDGILLRLVSPLKSLRLMLNPGDFISKRSIKCHLGSLNDLWLEMRDTNDLDRSYPIPGVEDGERLDLDTICSSPTLKELAVSLDPNDETIATASHTATSNVKILRVLNLKMNDCIDHRTAGDESRSYYGRRNDLFRHRYLERQCLLVKWFSATKGLAREPLRLPKLEVVAFGDQAQRLESSRFHRVLSYWCAFQCVYFKGFTGVLGWYLRGMGSREVIAM